jgi:plasmid stability protein
MATITIRNLDEKIKRRLQVRAALNGRSMEAEAREVLTGLVQDQPDPGALREDLGTAIHNRFAALGGVDLEIPPRQFAANPTTVIDRNPSQDSQPTEGSSASNKGPEEDFGTAIRKLFAPLGGVELQIPPRRKSHRPIPTFD